MNRWLSIAVAIGFAGCGQNEISSDFYEHTPVALKKKETRSTSCQGVSGYGGGFAAGFAGENTSSKFVPRKEIDIQKQMLIKRASLRFEVKKYGDARSNIARIIQQSNSYVASERESRSEFQISNAMTIRVPQSVFDNLIDTILTQCRNLDERSVNVDDVTEEYVDTDARMKAKREIENRYLQILNRAQTVKDILEVEQKLGGIREEIESAEGRLKYLTHQVSFSTIDLTFYENKNIAPGNRVGFIARTGSAFVNGWNCSVELIIGIISVWPFVVVMTGVVILIVKLIRRRMAKNVSSAEV